MIGKIMILSAFVVLGFVDCLMVSASRYDRKQTEKTGGSGTARQRSLCPSGQISGFSSGSPSYSLMPELAMVSTMLFWANKKMTMGTTIMTRVAAAAAPWRARPPLTIWFIA